MLESQRIVLDDTNDGHKLSCELCLEFHNFTFLESIGDSFDCTLARVDQLREGEGAHSDEEERLHERQNFDADKHVLEKKK